LAYGATGIVLEAAEIDNNGDTEIIVLSDLLYIKINDL
jgi:hypothetical protein